MENSIFLVILLEGFAAVSGLYYYQKKPTDKTVGFFAYFLLFTFFVENIGLIPAIIYYNEPLHFLKNTFWSQNYWLYNPYLIISFTVYILFFKWNISNIKVAGFLNKVLVLYVLICIANLMFSDVFLKGNSVLTYISGSLFLLGVIFYYYYEILVSARILIIKNEISFYISFTALLFFLATTPIFIYSKYFTTQSPEFVELSNIIMVGMNIFMYSAYSIAFLLLANKKTPKNLKKNAF